MIVLRCHVVLVRRRSQRHADPGNHVEVLDRDRHTCERWQRVAAAGLRDRLLGLGGLIAGQVSGDREIGPDLVVQPVDSVKVVPGDLDR